MKWPLAKSIAQVILDDLNKRYAPREVGVIVRALARLLRKQEYTSEEEQTNNEKP